MAYINTLAVVRAMKTALERLNTSGKKIESIPQEEMEYLLEAIAEGIDEGFRQREREKQRSWR